MAQFVLIHGGFHGAWCWERFEPELHRRGHGTLAMDLPVDRPGALMDDYADSVLAAMDRGGGDRPYLVGHSMGGMVAPRVAARLPEARIVFLCAGFAHTTEAERLEGAAATASDFFQWLVGDDQGRLTMPREQAIAAFYHDVAPDLADWAASRLRPQWGEGFTRVGAVAPYADRVAGVICTQDDRIIDVERHRLMSRGRFGIAPVTLPGGHSPFLSRPVELAATLDRIAALDT